LSRALSALAAASSRVPGTLCQFGKPDVA